MLDINYIRENTQEVKKKVATKNFDPKVPCHRVIRADGKVGDYNRGGAFRKQKLLEEEGALKKKK